MILSENETATFWLEAFRHRGPDTTLITKLRFQKVLYKVKVEKSQSLIEAPRNEGVWE